MAASLSDEAKFELIARHSGCELVHDWDGARATLTDDCYYEFYPQGVRLRGVEAIQAQWERCFALPVMNTKEIMQARTAVWLSTDNATAVIEWPVRCADGVSRMTTSWGVYTFRGNLISSETVYTDSVLTPFMADVFDENFFAIPGVERISPRDLVAHGV